MPFTLSAATTINGLTNSYVLTGSGNLDDLATAASGVGFTRVGEVYTFDPAGTARILAISGTLTENRKGIRTVNVRGNGHICWGYGVGSETALGLLDSTSGVYTGEVNVVYEPSALTLGADLMNGTEGKCFIGAGTFRFVSGSVSYLHTTRSDLDIFNSVTLAAFDNVSIYMTSAGNSYSHFWKPGSKTTTTNRTIFTFQPRPIEGPNTVTSVTPFYTDTGFRWLSPAAGSVLRIERPTYSGVDIAGGTATSEIHIVDPQSPWMGPVESSYAPHTGIKKIFRTLRAKFVDSLGVTITNAPPKLVTVTPAGGSTVSNFSGTAGTSEVLQSTRASGVSHNATGTGWTNQGAYDFYAVGFGYAAKNLGVNLGAAYTSTEGVLWSPTSNKSDLVTTAYASVAVAPFTFSTTGAGTLQVVENATVKQASEYLFKLAYDNADASFWRGLGHTPADLTDGVIDFGSINIVVGSGATLSGQKFKTGGTVTGAGVVTASYEDSAGVRVTVRKLGGGNFNIAARAGVTGAYTNLGFLEGVSAATYTVAKGTPVEVAMWSLGCVTYTRTISTVDGGVVYDAEMIVNDDINTALDVSGYLANIVLSIDTSITPNKFVITFNAPMTVSGIELGKAVVHQLVGRQVALQSSLPPGSTTTIAINSDEITNNLPAVRFDVGSSLSVTDRVYLDFFVNQAAALLLDSNYIINPPRADGNQVQIFRAKPAIDPSVMASAVRTEMERTGGMLSALPSLADIEAAKLPVNVVQVNAVAVGGTGTEGDEWGPAA